MALSDITKKIISDASFEKEKLVKEAEEKARLFLADAKSHAEIMKKEGEEKLKKALSDNLKKVETGAELEKRRMVELLRDEVIKNAFENVSALVEKFSDNEYEGFTERILKILPKKITGKVVAPKGRLAPTKHAFKNAGISITDFSETSEWTVGCKILNKDYDYDLTLPSLINKVRESEYGSVASKLFK
ncbi:MAG: hypothetical protein Q8P52_03450 [bacterium]|nr:hypothetical protein [bacterium]